MAPGQQPSSPLSPLPVQPLSPQPARFKYTKVLVSVALFLIGAAIPISMVNPDGSKVGLTLSQHLTIGYVLWALFWGAPAAWRLWRRFIFNKSMIFLGGCGPAGLAWLVTAPLLLIFGGWGYCILGGGIYQFLKHLWSVSRTA
jgi:hypothetical protein